MKPEVEILGISIKTFGVTFALAHCSTRYFEQPITRNVRRLTSKRRREALTARTQPPPAAASRLCE